MKKPLIIIVAAILLTGAQCFSQAKADSVKTGWNIGFLPAVAFDSDLGIYYGIIINPYDYKDGSIYPNYYQSLYLQVSAYSRGSYEHALEYKSYSLLPGIRLLAGVKFIGYKAYPFYGYDGNSSIYHYEWEDEDDPQYRTRIFYRLERKYVRLYADLQDTIGSSRFQWHAGWSLSNYRIGPVNVEKINEKLDDADKLPVDESTLYDYYVDWGIISPEEMNGGTTNNLNLGLIYDSRNKLTNPDRGIFTEFNLRWMPSALTSGRYNALSVGIIHKQYLTLVKRRLIFAYRLWWNSNIGGNQPFYTRQLLTTFEAKEGYGGSSTIRGALMQRIVAKEFMLGTFELRSRIFNYRFINQNWYLGAIAFVDAGKIIRPYDPDLSGVDPDLINDFFGTRDKSVHKSIGGGLKMAMNENFVLSAEFAMPVQRQDGTFGLYLGLDYQF